MTAYATTTQLQSRWPALTDTATAGVLLEDAGLWLRTWFPDLDARIASGVLDAGVPEMISCAMVKRAMLASEHEGQANPQPGRLPQPRRHPVPDRPGVRRP